MPGYVDRLKPIFLPFSCHFEPEWVKKSLHSAKKIRFLTSSLLSVLDGVRNDTKSMAKKKASEEAFL